MPGGVAGAAAIIAAPLCRFGVTGNAMVLMRSAWVLAMVAVTVLAFCRMGQSGGLCGVSWLMRRSDLREKISHNTVFFLF
jgi:hypothetical protein